MRAEWLFQEQRKANCDVDVFLQAFHFSTGFAEQTCKPEPRPFARDSREEKGGRSSNARKGNLRR